MRAVDPESFTEFSGAIGEIDISPRCSAAPAHEFDPLQRLQRPDQYRARLVDGARHGIHTPVHAVNEVDVGDAGRAVQRRRARGSSGRGVASKIVLANIGFGLDDSA